MVHWSNKGPQKRERLGVWGQKKLNQAKAKVLPAVFCCLSVVCYVS